MWRGGFDPGLVAWIFNVVGLLFGAALGARALVDPKWAARFVRLQPDEQGGGFAEFRATYGGVFLMLHLAALVFSLKWLLGGEFIFGIYAAGAAAPVAAGWAGSSAGRALSMWRDGTRTQFNTASAGVEAVLAAAIASPWLLWNFSPPA